MADAMHEAMLDARQEGGSYRRIELITGQRRRRQWTAEEKARIVAESLEEGANISEASKTATKTIADFERGAREPYRTPTMKAALF